MNAAVAVDTEWGYRDGRRDCESALEPVVLCARVLPSGKEYSFRGRDGGLEAFVADHADDLWVAHSATAEMKYLLRLGIRLPSRWFCTMTAYRHLYNAPGQRDSSLVAALTAARLESLIPFNKTEIREQILELKFADADIASIVDYCFADVRATAAIFERWVARVNPERMQYWAEYLVAVARMELRGVPMDTIAMRAVVRNRQHVEAALRAKINATAPLYHAEGSFSRKAFLKWAARRGICWPRKRSPTTGRPYLPINDETLEAMEFRDPFIGELRQVRKFLKSLGRRSIKVDGRTQRHYFSTMPFRTITGRNQPTRFVFAAAKWLRWLVVPQDGNHVLVYADYAAQEIGIAAAMSGDAAMQEMYAAGDPHIAFAIMAGAAPAGATKATRPEIRKAYKTVNLGVLYQQTEYGIADRLGISTDEAARLLAQHRQLFHAFWSWSGRVQSAAYHRRYATTRMGWRARVTADSNFRTWGNFPIQATGADIMRATTIGLDRQKVQVLAIVHDGWLLACRREELPNLTRAIEAARRFACDAVLDGFALKVDTTVHEDRFRDEDGAAMWNFVQAALPKEKPYVAAE